MDMHAAERGRVDHHGIAMIDGCVELGEDAQGKIRQEHRWGTDTWIKAYGRRTFVEGGFGILRNPALGGLSRGLFCIIGRIKVTLWLAALVAASNIASLANWATRTGVDSDDPALAPITDDDWAFEELDPSSTTGTDPPPTATPELTDHSGPAGVLVLPRHTEHR